jgi:microcompartment protein CcmK/EutM
VIVGVVIGSVWATRKHAGLQGQRLLLVQQLDEHLEPTGQPFASLDTCDAGPGDRVLVATSAEAAVPFRPQMVVTDATVVGVLEALDLAADG